MCTPRGEASGNLDVRLLVPGAGRGGASGPSVRAGEQTRAAAARAPGSSRSRISGPPQGLRARSWPHARWAGCGWAAGAEVKCSGGRGI